MNNGLKELPRTSAHTLQVLPMARGASTYRFVGKITVLGGKCVPPLMYRNGTGRYLRSSNDGWVVEHCVPDQMVWFTTR